MLRFWMLFSLSYFSICMDCYIVKFDFGDFDISECCVPSEGMVSVMCPFQLFSVHKSNAFLVVLTIL